MTIKIWWTYWTIQALYDWIKAVFTSHLGWTNNTDTPVSWNAFVLEYTSNVTLDWENIKIKISTDVNGYATIWVYDSTSTLRSTTTWSTSISAKACYVMVWDDFILITTNSSALGCLLAWNLIDYANKWGLIWADLLVYWVLVSAWTWIFRARVYNSSWAIANWQPFNYFDPATQSYTQNNNAEQWTFQVLFPCYATVYSTVWYSWILKSWIFYSTDSTSNPLFDNTATIQWHIYRRVALRYATGPRWWLLVKWEEVA